MNIAKLDAMIKEVAPIDGVNSDGVVSFRPEATKDEIAAALAVVAEQLPLLSDAVEVPAQGKTLEERVSALEALAGIKG